MKKNLFQSCKQGYYHIAILLFMMLSLSPIKTIAQGQLTIIESGNGWALSCVGDIKTYSLQNAVSGVTYTWSISPAGQNTLTYLPNNQVQIQWMTVNYNYMLYVNGSNGSAASYNLTVLDALSPFITTSSEVGCEVVKKRDEYSGNVIVDDENGCKDVCENSTVSYHANSMGPITAMTLSRFEWSVVGGVFAINGLTTLTGSTFQNQFTDVTVIWGAAGAGSITVKEICYYGCPDKEKTVCITKIETPIAGFIFDGLSPNDYPPDRCYKICLNHEVNFEDLSTASAISPILYWEWDFGDNTPFSALKNPSHTYVTSSNYTVVLKVTNKCGCVSIFKREICVMENKSPDIYCPSVVCENTTAIYGSLANCNPFTWNIVGGTQQPTQNHNEVAVNWDNVGPGGFGMVSLFGRDCEGSCPNWSTVRVPVILANGTIDGPTTVCGNSYYIYKLPAWPATNFTWQVIDNNGTGTITNSHVENGNEIEIKTGNIQGSFQIKCSYINTVVECQGTAIIDVYIKSQPVITTPLQSCLGSAVLCSVSNPPASSGITTWTVIQPNGITNSYPSVSGVNNYTFAASLFNVEGNYTIQASNPTVFCDPEPVIVTVVKPPAAPGNIIGDNKVCLNYPYTYTVDALPNTTVSWVLLNGYVSGSPGVTTATGNTINVIWTANGSIAVSRTWDDIPGCTSGNLAKFISQIVVSGTIVKTPDPNPSVCEDATANFNLILNNGVIGETYEWIIYPAAMGSIISGQGTTSCSILFNHVGTNSCQVKCKVTKCGVSTDIGLTVGIQGATTITSFTPQNTTICSGYPTGITFTAITGGSSPASANAFIWDFGDGSSATTNTGVTNHIFSNFTAGNQTYTASIKVISSCNSVISAAAFATVTVQPQPNASISPGGVTLVCPPASFSFPTTISNVNPAPGAYTYQWYKGTTPCGTGLTYNITAIGDYYAIVTNTATGCWTKTNIRTVQQDPNCNCSCTPVGPAGITNFTATLSSCGEVKATCTTLGTYLGNIVSPPDWTFFSNGVPYNTTGPSNSFSNSPTYTVTKPGIYQIQILVSYQNSISGNPPCAKMGFANVIVPIIADFKWGMVCNGGGTGYNLTLTDNSPVYGNNPVTYRTWKINGVTQGTAGSGSPSFTQSMTPYLGTSITVDLIVNNGSLHNCTKTVIIDIPNLPVADFTITTTNTPNIHTKSCEGREVIFTNNSSPTATIVTNVWTFGDGTKLHAVDAARVYGFNSTPSPASINLTITDKYNCTKSKSYNLTIEENLLSANLSNGSNYTLNPPLPPCYAPGQTVTVSVNAGGGSPNGYQWYRETLPIAAANANPYAANTQGAYWVQLSNAKYCLKNINPTPAVVSFKYPVQAVINGKQDACAYEAFTLKGPTGTGLSYSWVRNPGNISCGNTRVINQSIGQGNYTYTLSLTQAGGCPSVSAPFAVEVHNLPLAPTTSMHAVDCKRYEIELSAYSSITSDFTWSNGQSGSPIKVTHGGPYRVWLTDQFGCRNHTDIDVPLAPSTYFWRFPTGCYTYCPGELPKWVDGPSHVNFNYWEWLITNNAYTNTVSPNNNVSGSGSNSICNPLWLDQPPLGSGSGDYNWLLDNGLCKQESDFMVVDMKKECCDVKMKDIKINCNQSTGNYDIVLNIDNNTPGCNNAFYNLYILDPVSMQSIISVSSQSPATVVPGQNTIHATIPVTAPFNTTNTHVIIKIEVFCNSWEQCIGLIDAIIPDCKYKSTQPIPFADTETDYISELSIAPNPANTEVNISYRFTNNHQTNSRAIQVYDAVGRPVSEIKIKDATGIYKLNVSNYAQGIYFIEIRENNNHVLTKRMLINH